MVRSAAVSLEQGRAAAAKPLTLHRLFWFYVVAGVTGNFIEVAFWLVTRGELISRSSLVMGPFSIVWGAGAVLLTIALHPIAGRALPLIFAAGTVLGGVYEYVCSWFQEEFFGVCFWDYSHLPLNLNGRVNLIFCLFWGAAAVAWVRYLCPMLSLFVERLPQKRDKVLTTLVALFLTVSTILSAAALVRMDQRQEGVPASGSVQVWLDQRFPDQWMISRYPNMGVWDPDAGKWVNARSFNS